MPSATAPLLGAVLSERYDLTGLIARGGMGDVYEATDGLLGRQVAVKAFRDDALADRSRFDTEVRTLAALSHPGLVQVFDAGEHDGHSYVVLELIDGPSLRSVLDEHGPLSSTEVAAVGAAILSALAYVHGEGVVHRDVTPSNILCGPGGRHRLADFGIARLLDTSRVTAVTATLGTAAYMAPEQVEGRDVTPAADVYSLGLVLLEALAGRPAFVGAGHEVALARLARDPDIPAEVPPGWRSVLTAMTAREAVDRPSSAELATDLAALAAGGGVEAPLDQLDALLPLAAAGWPSGHVVQDADGHALTEALQLDGGTTVLPAALRPEAEAASGSRPFGPAGGVPRRRLWLALGVLVAVVLAALVAGDDVRLEVPTVTTQPVVTVPVSAPTTSPPATTAPSTGKGKGHEKSD